MALRPFKKSSLNPIRIILGWSDYKPEKDSAPGSSDDKDVSVLDKRLDDLDQDTSGVYGNSDWDREALELEQNSSGKGDSDGDDNCEDSIENRSKALRLAADATAADDDLGVLYDGNVMPP